MKKYFSLLVAFNLLLLGFTSILAQSVLFREYLVVFYGNEITIGIFFALWFAWIAGGAYLFNKTESRINDPVRFLLHLEFFYFPFIIIQFLFIRGVRSILSLPLETILPLTTTFWVSACLAAPTGLWIGYLFPLSAKSLKPLSEKIQQKTTARFYAAESAGSIAGGLVFSLWAVRHLTHLDIIIYMIITGWVILCILSALMKHRIFALVPGLCAALLAFSWIFLPGFSDNSKDFFDKLQWKSLYPKFEHVASKDSRFQHVSIGKIKNQYSLLGDGHFITSFPEKKENEKLAALLMSENPRSKSVLIIGYAPAGLIRELLKYPLKEIHLVILDRVLFDLVTPYLPPEDKKALVDPRLNVIFSDGRKYINSTAGNKKIFDAVLLNLPDPTSAFINRYYTEEFYESIRRVLNPDGIYITGVSSAENYFNKEVTSFSGSVYKTLKKVFRNIAVTPGEKNIFIAGGRDAPVTDDYFELIIRHNKFKSKSGFPSMGFRTVFQPERLGFTLNALEGSAAKPNRDFEPVTYFYNLMLWSNYTGSEFLKGLMKIHTGGVWVFLIPLFIVFITRIIYTGRYPSVELERRWNASVLMLLMGGVAMALEVMFLYLYQSRLGYIYEKIGIMVSLFMLGLALGAGIVSLFHLKPRLCERLLIVLAFMNAVFIYYIPSIFHNYETTETLFYILICVSGLLTGMVFPLSLNLHHAVSRHIDISAGVVDCADHIGAAVGSLLVGSILIPILNIENTCRILSSACIFSGALLFKTHIEKRRHSRKLEFLSMPFPRLSWTLIVFTISIFLVTLFINIKSQSDKKHFDDRTLSAVSGSDRFVLSDEPFTYYKGMTQKNVQESAAFGSISAIGKVRGYGGPINILLAYDLKGNIRGIQMEHNSETPGYIGRIQEWFKNFIGKNIQKDYPFRNEPPHALTGATITGNAAIAIINRSSLAYADKLVHLEITNRQKEISAWHLFFNIKNLIIALIFIVSIWTYLRFGRRVRLLLLFINTVVLGFYMNLPFTFVDLANITVGKIPGLINSPWILSVSLITLSALLWGQFYCGYICPFGALQELISEMGRPLRITISEKLEWHARYIKYVLLAGGGILFWITGRLVWIQWSPMQFIFSGQQSGIMLYFIVVVLVLCLFLFRFWCRYFCPVGAFLAIWNKLSLLDRFAPKRVYNRCDLGVQGHFDMDCLKCNRCTFQQKEPL